MSAVFSGVSISIHAPRTGSDSALGSVSIHAQFQSTLPARGATPSRAPRRPWPSHFNPRSPHGERRRTSRRCSSSSVFQSTLPARGATGECKSKHTRPKFQSTLPARGATRGLRHKVAVLGFQSTLPARGATVREWWLPRRRGISIHAPRTGSDEAGRAGGRPKKAFQSTLPARGATALFADAVSASKNFNPRSPHGERPIAAVTAAVSSGFQSTLPARGATSNGLPTSPPY